MLQLQLSFPRIIMWELKLENTVLIVDMHVSVSWDSLAHLKKMTVLRGSRSYGRVLTRKPRRPSLVEILCRGWTGALIDWGSAELLPDRSQLTAEAPLNASLYSRAVSVQGMKNFWLFLFYGTKMLTIQSIKMILRKRKEWRLDADHDKSNLRFRII
jgi:hypothetical protein